MYPSPRARVRKDVHDNLLHTKLPRQATRGEASGGAPEGDRVDVEEGVWDMAGRGRPSLRHRQEREPSPTARGSGAVGAEPERSLPQLPAVLVHRLRSRRLARLEVVPGDTAERSVGSRSRRGTHAQERRHGYLPSSLHGSNAEEGQINSYDYLFVVYQFAEIRPNFNSWVMIWTKDKLVFLFLVLIPFIITFLWKLSLSVFDLVFLFCLSASII